MKRFKNILVVVNDDSHATANLALSQGIELAKKNGGRLTLMSAINPPGSSLSRYKGILKKEEVTTMLVSEREQALSKAAEQSGNGVDINIKVVIGKDFIEIVRQVVLGKHDLLIKVANTHPESFDSSDFHIMRKCPQPVWLLKPRHHGNPQKILAAIVQSVENSCVETCVKEQVFVALMRPRVLTSDAV